VISDGPSVVHLAAFVNGYPFKPDDLGDEGVPVIRIRHLLDETVEPERAFPPVRAVYIDDGDLVFSWSATLAVRRWGRGRALLNQHLFKVEPRAGVDTGWLRYVLEAGIDRLKPLMHGSAMTHITNDMLRMLRVRLPSLGEQRAIADYLDRVTARIDVLLRDAESLKQLSQERIWTRFCETVTSTTAPEVPLRRVLLSISDGPFGSAFTSNDYSDDGAFVVRLGNIGMAEFHREPEARIPMTLYAEFLRHQVRPGDLLIAGLGDEGRHAGRACVAPDLGPAMVKGKCFCARVDQGLADPRYLARYLSSPLGAQEVALVSHGAGRVMINLEIAKALPVILPARPLQTEIFDQTAVEQERADRAEVLLDRQIALLRERRQALITAAVTGQLEIPGVAA
jgi:type I restriction enzyme S subunit